jgi:predicted permease
MLWFFRFLFLGVLGSMLWVTGWARLHQSVYAIPREVFTHPWFIATLFDAYWGFLTFYVWQAWKEQSLAARGLWFIAVMLLGNIAMSVYVLAELFRIRTSSQLAEVITRRNPGRVPLPAALVVVAVGIYLLA